MATPGVISSSRACAISVVYPTALINGSVQVRYMSSGYYCEVVPDGSAGCTYR